ncbi:MAG: peptide ABC transporter permease [Deltaproteobacteria bacterium CG11_big_fil_rev_8_21_14_0_20_42_23]|nr:MAG: peptide ABC transporter permease [Deltaproteobacteria bacterium CG11_big_fil_rev_8_21_14_0_20_42_23]PJC63496.1 MAG: peptide ABC transporter permease [Deltaproteobacteria bacterium CG_4_9_14_0_2_um_filter_42_21]
MTNKEALVEEKYAEAGTSLWQDAWKRLLKNRMAVASGAFILLTAALSLLSPLISPYEVDTVNYSAIGQGPSFAHFFGTDVLGRDLFSRCLFGLRISLAIGVTSTLVTFVIGVVWGAVSGYFGGKIDSLMMRIVDILYALPYMFFVIVLMTVFGRNILLLFAAIGAVSWLTMARIVRGQVMSIRKKEFIEAAVSCGVGHRAIIFRHLIPNALGPIIVYVTLMVPRLILVEAFLSFLGLGVQAPLASLGSLTSDGAQGMELYPWLILFPGGILAVLLFALNYLGDGLRDALDPKMKL